MSRLQNKPAPTIVEPEEFEEQNKEVVYSPKHPALVFHAELQAYSESDHLDNYVEVQPFKSNE
jgi:hypothetical protein